MTSFDGRLRPSAVNQKPDFAPTPSHSKRFLEGLSIGVFYATGIEILGIERPVDGRISSHRTRRSRPASGGQSWKMHFFRLLARLATKRCAKIFPRAGTRKFYLKIFQIPFQRRIPRPAAMSPSIAKLEMFSKRLHPSTVNGVCDCRAPA